MIDINLLRNDPDLVRENIKKKFQDKKLPLVDEILALDEKRRDLQKEGDSRRAMRNALSSKIGSLMKEKKTEEAQKVKAEVVENNARIAEIEKESEIVAVGLKEKMMAIPNIIADDVPIGRDDSENVERQAFSGTQGQALRSAVSSGYFRKIVRHRSGQRKAHERAGLLLSFGRRGQTAFRRAHLRARLYDR